MLTFVHPDELTTHWPFLETGLAAILARGTETWNPTDIRRHLRQGKASLFLVADKGWLICERCTDPISSEPYLNVFLMYFKPGEGVKLYREMLGELDKMKKDGRMEWIQFSGREDWRGMIEGDFQFHATTWRRYGG